MNFVADDEEIRLPRHRIHYALNLVNAVQFVIDRAGNGQTSAQAFENGWQFRLLEVAEKDARGRRPAIHHDHIMVHERIHHEVNGRRMAGVNEADFRMEAF